MTGLIFEEGPHRYRLDDEIVPSVTQVLQRSGIVDFTGVPGQILHAAQVRGTVVHSAIHFYNEGDLDADQFRSDFPTYAGYLDAWIALCAERAYVPILNEYRVASRRHKLAGTLDTLGLFDGRAALLDFATGRPQDVAKDLQTAAYYGLAIEWAAEGDARLAEFFAEHKIVRRYAIGLRRDGTFLVEPYSNPSDYRHFMVLLEAQRVVDARRGERYAYAEAV